MCCLQYFQRRVRLVEGNRQSIQWDTDQGSTGLTTGPEWHTAAWGGQTLTGVVEQTLLHNIYEHLPMPDVATDTEPALDILFV